MLGMSAGTIFVHLGLKNAMLLSGLKASENMMKHTFRRMTSLSMRWAKRGAVATLAYTAASVKAFASFEEQMAEVSTMLDDHTMRYMPAYTKAVKGMAIEFGEGSKTISKGLYDILSAAIPASKAVDVLSVAVKASKAGMTDTRVAADAITSVLNSYEMSAKDAMKVSDILFTTVKRGKITFEQLASSIGMVASVAATGGMSFEEVSAAIATMTRAGMPAERAITSLRQIINTMLKPLDKAARLAQEEFGVAMNSATFESEGLLGVLEKLKEASPEQIVAMFGNIRAFTGMSAVLKQAAEFGYDYELMLDHTGRTEEALAKMTNTLAFQMRRMWQAIKMISVAIGSRLRKPMMALTNWVVENQRRIEIWGIRVIEVFKAVGVGMYEMITLFFTPMQRDFEQNLNDFTALLVDFGLAVGASFFQIMYRAGLAGMEGLKAAFFGPDELSADELFDRTVKLYEAAGGKIKKQMMMRGKGQAAGFLQIDVPDVATDIGSKARFKKEWEKSQKQARAEHRMEPIKPLLGDLKKDLSFTWGLFAKEAEHNLGNVGDALTRMFGGMGRAWNLLSDEEKWIIFSQQATSAFEKVKKGFHKLVVDDVQAAITQLKGEEAGEIFAKEVEQTIKDLGMLKRTAIQAAAAVASIFPGASQIEGIVDVWKDTLKDLGIEAKKINKIPLTMDQKDAIKNARELIDELKEERKWVGLINEERERAVRLSKFIKILNDENLQGTKEYYEMVLEYENQLTALGKEQRQADRTLALKQWGEDAENVWGGIAEASASGLDSMADQMGKFLSGQKADWRSWAASVIQEIQRVIIKMLMLKAIEGAMAASGSGLSGSSANPTYAPHAKGGAFNQGHIIPMAQGEIIQQATLRPLANNKTALMGEAGAEAIMPLERDKSGRLGVVAKDKNTGKTDVLLEDILVAIQEQKQVNATVVDHRNVMTEEAFGGRMGEEMVMTHVARNQ